jgi:DNA-binding MarR family transcriptional regulator
MVVRNERGPSPVFSFGETGQFSIDTRLAVSIIVTTKIVMTTNSPSIDFGSDTRASEPSLAALLAAVRYRLKQEVLREIQGHGVTTAQMRLLLGLPGAESLSITDLAARTMMDPPMVTRVVDRLVAATLVARHPDKADRRRVRVSLTARGRALRRRLRPVAARIEERSLRGLAKQEEALLRALLRRVLSNLEATA